jgi:SAM-dependent methyltransferase
LETKVTSRSIDEAVDLGMAIQGWKTREELAWLAGQAARARFVLDVGCWRGQTTKVMASVCRGTVIAVDHLHGIYTGDTGRNEILRESNQMAILRDFLGNLERELYELRVHGIFENGEEARDAVRQFAGRVKFDLVWLDGDHDYEDVRDDIQAYRPLMAERSVLAGHDYDPTFPGVIRAVDEFCPGFKRGPASIWYREM